jgi:acetyl esterase/lipase
MPRPLYHDFLMKFILFLCMNLLLSACTSVGFMLANANVFYADMTVKRNIPFGDKPYLTLDLYRSKNKDNHRVLIFYYGGGWTAGKKEDYAFVADRFTREGYTVVIPDYGKYPDVTYPTFVEQSARAVAWVHQHVTYDKLFLMGHSAGAYNAVMLATNPRFLAAYELKQSDIDGVIGLAGPYGFTPDSKKYRAIFSNMGDYKQMNVSTFVTGNEPPMLLLHGATDETVSAENSYVLANNLRASGASAEIITYPDLGHLKIIGALAERWKDDAPIARDASTFMERISAP